MSWGKQKGCQFLELLCDKQYSEFSTPINIHGCSTDFLSKGSYFESSSDEYFDYCNIWRPVWLNDTNVEGDCTAPSRKFTNLDMTNELDETFGGDSRCYVTNYKNLNRVDINVPPIQVECHRSICKLVNNIWELYIVFSNQVVKCPPTGGLINLGIDLSGTITCPHPSEICETFENWNCPLNCSAKGRCIEAKCVCFPGYEGELCEIGLGGITDCLYPLQGGECQNYPHGCYLNCENNYEDNGNST